jgi:hypothetical protein
MYMKILRALKIDIEYTRHVPLTPPPLRWAQQRRLLEIIFLRRNGFRDTVFYAKQEVNNILYTEIDASSSKENRS